ncbi:ecotin [Chryseobacterium sp. CBSDS_008]|uniref:ecotin n=1 Tax=Chryseobacterium sp. CBSDS_008 TaxID=3415265 RepID=UPI003CE9C45D
MKNKKLEELSKKITQGKIKKLKKYEVLTIYAGKKSIIEECYDGPNCYAYCGPAPVCLENNCWMYS